MRRTSRTIAIGKGRSYAVFFSLAHKCQRNARRVARGQLYFVGTKRKRTAVSSWLTFICFS